MDIYDENGKKVLTLTAVAGRPPVTSLVYLTTGVYNVVYTAQSLSGKALPAINFWLDGADFSDPSGPYFVSPTSTAPSGSNNSPTPPPPSNTTYTTTKPSSSTTKPYYY
jgi:hypothetical protein